MPNLDSDLLRTFLAVKDTGSILAGAERIHRTQSAVSVQIRKLEELIGKEVFVRHGRGVRLTSVGEELEPVARSIVGELNNIFNKLTGAELSGSLCIGIRDDHSSDLLSSIIADFARDNPNVELNVQRSMSSQFSKALSSGRLDIAVHEVPEIGPNMEFIREEHILWASSRIHNVHKKDILPVALFDVDCWWRDVALSSLEESGRPFKIVYSSESVSGVAAAVKAGVAIGILNREMLSPDMVQLNMKSGFKPLPTSKLVIEYGRNINVELCEAMAVAIRRAFGIMK
ncbi:LysR substrate-binding domain-containing protein [Curvivirga sp.]|uniref:LysR substrate-binding domain-containing protein n=1 Tax=Curvivirga sp. TaxID=2856848 RepID=UPI003B5A8B07